MSGEWFGVLFALAIFGCALYFIIKGAVKSAIVSAHHEINGTKAPEAVYVPTGTTEKAPPSSDDFGNWG